jgi:hypothetical protein
LRVFQGDGDLEIQKAGTGQLWLHGQDKHGGLLVALLYAGSV